MSDGAPDLLELAAYAGGAAIVLGLVLLFGSLDPTVGSVAAGLGLLAAGGIILHRVYRTIRPAQVRAPGWKRPARINHKRVARAAQATIIQALSLEAIPSGGWGGAVDGCRVVLRPTGDDPVVSITLPGLVPLLIPSRQELLHDHPYADDLLLGASPGDQVLSDPALVPGRIVCPSPQAEAWTAALKQLPPGLLARVFQEMPTHLRGNVLTVSANTYGASDGAATGRDIVERVRRAAQLARLLGGASKAIR